MEIYAKISVISIFSLFFWFWIMILSYTLILPISQLQTQQLMTSQSRSHVEYLIQIYNIFVLILYSKLMRNVAALAVFITIYWWFLIVACFFGPPCIYPNPCWLPLRPIMLTFIRKKRQHRQHNKETDKQTGSNATTDVTFLLDAVVCVVCVRTRRQ